MKLIFNKFILALCLLLPSLSGLAWDRIGHQLIAQIALDNMQVAAKYRALQLVNEMRQQYGYTTFVQSATWADDIRGHDVQAFTPWHYINQGFTPDETPMPMVQKQNVVWAIIQAETVLQSPRAKLFEQALFFRFLIHFIGDIHQPLHAATRVTAALPQGDAGGNLYPIHYHSIKNLHKFWDRGAGYFTAEYRFPLKPWQIKKLANEIQEQYPRQRLQKSVADLDPNHWAKESYFYAKTQVYKTPKGQRPSAHYIKQSREIVKQQIALAGYRLAGVLNFIFTSAA